MSAPDHPNTPATTLDFPIIFLLPTHLSADELEKLEDQIPTLTYDINEAEVILGKVFRKERALFELRKLKLATEEIQRTGNERPTSRSPARKRAKLTISATRSSGISSDTLDSDTTASVSNGEIQRRLAGPGPAEQTVRVVKLAWFTESIKTGKVLPVRDYLVYEGRKLRMAPAKQSEKTPPPSSEKAVEVMKRALADAESSPGSGFRPPSSQGRRGETYSNHPVKRPPLVRQTTSEHEIDTQLPPIPDYLHTTYSCQRPTPVNPPNESFIKELEKIKTARTLMGDRVGVRAYSSAIATIAAYPYAFKTAQGG